MSSAAEDAKTYVIDASSTVKIYLAEKGTRLKDAAVNTVEDVTQFISDTSGTVWEYVVDVSGNAWTFVKNASGKIADAFDEPTQQVSSFISSLFAE